MTYDEVCERLEKLKEYDYIQQNANDYYFSSYEYKQIKAEIQKLESLKKELEANENFN